jgi:uncharacterized protein
LIGGADVNSRDQDGMTILHYAVDRSLFDISSMLILQYKADVNAQDNEGETPLMLAITCEHEEMVITLLHIIVSFSITFPKYMTQLRNFKC